MTTQYYDLSHPLSDKTPPWPGDRPFQLCLQCGRSEQYGYEYALGQFSCSEHVGTHVDAPFHFCKAGATVDQLCLEQLIAPCKVIDIQRQCEENQNYALSEKDLLDFEQKYGQLQPKEILLICTGWHRKYHLGSREYYGYREEQYDPEHSELQFPGIGEDAARFLVERGILGVGLDSPSLDCGPAKDFIAHTILLSHGLYGIENLNDQILQLPAVGATLFVLPLKLVGGSGAPARILATVSV